MPKPPQTHFKGVFQSANLAARNRAPMIAGMIAIVLTGFIGFSIVVAAWTQIPEVTRAPGEITPTDDFQQIEAPEFSTVKAVEVREGDVVKKGDVLAQLASAEIERDLASVREELASIVERARNHTAVLTVLDSTEIGDEVLKDVPLELETARSALSLLALREKAELAALERLKANIESEQAAMRRLTQRRSEKSTRLAVETDLFNRGLSTRSVVTEIEDDVSRIDDQIHTLDLSISAKKREADLQLAGLAQARWELREENTIVSLDLRQSRLLKETDIRSLRARSRALEIVAPVDGVIHSVGFPNAGEVIDRGETLFELLPTGEALIAVIRLPTREVGHVSTGMGVKLRLETFDARTTLPLEGEVMSISPNRVFDRDLGTDYFRATVFFDEESRAFEILKEDLSAGMVVTAEIVTRYRSLLSYIMKPVERSVRMAFSER